MSNLVMTADLKNHDEGNTTVFGFWIYIMSDCILFACLFATHAVLSGNTFAGPTHKELFSMSFVLVETLLLLSSSFTYGLAMLAMHRNRAAQINAWLLLTFLLGAGFIAMELYEFHHLIMEGNSWQRSASISSFFGLVATHGLHVTIGLVWMLVLMYSVWRFELTPQLKTRLTCLSLFWHFLDVIWICVFTFVYLMGAIAL